MTRSALSASEDFVNQGKRAPLLAGTTAQHDAGTFASIAVPDDSGGLLNVLVDVFGPNKSALAGAKVTVASFGAPKHDASPDDAVRTAQCVTVVGGTCMVSLPSDALQVQRPITAVATNIEHPQFAYDLTQPVASAKFP